MKRLLFALVCLTGCALSHTVNDDVFQDMSVDKKLRLFEAENDISIAIDERDQMRERIRELKREIRSAQVERRVADEEAAHEGREGGKQAQLSDAMWNSRLEYLDGSIAYLRRRMSAQDSVILLARAKFELAKALIIKRYKLEGAESINIKDFEHQVVECNEQMHVTLQEVEQGRSPLERLRAEWLRLRDELASGSLQNMVTPGDDELPVWENW